ncbi:MAG: hypothetical protein RQ745_06220 [Longimicrobiales bacterium]|nr:hypothetical protein [Longimicrobiales bacterium]
MKSRSYTISSALVVLGVTAATVSMPAESAAQAVCRPDDPSTRADVTALLTDEDKAGARERAGLAQVDPQNLAVVTDARVCAQLRKQFMATYNVQGAESPYVAVYYRVDDRFVAHIIPREALEPPPVPQGTVYITETKVVLIVYDEDFRELRTLVI